MKFRILFFLCFVHVGLFAQVDVPKVKYGSIERLQGFGTLVDSRNIDVWLPPGYSPSKKKYPVLYLHDGQMLFDSNLTWNKQEWAIDEKLGTAMLEGKLPEFIVVGIWNNGSKRRSEYLPQKALKVMNIRGKEFVLSAKKDTMLELFEFPLSANQYLKFLVDELKPKIDSKYSTLDDSSHTFIGGSSMGGLISLYAICEYPSVFGGAICMSTHWPGLFYKNQQLNPFPESMFEYLKSKIPTRMGHKIYFDCGDQTLDSLYLPFQRRADDICKNKGYSSELGNFLSEFFPGQNHSEVAWSLRITDAAIFMMTAK